MSSLRRILSLERTDNLSLPLPSPHRGELTRHQSLPTRSLYDLRCLHSLPLPSSRFFEDRYGRCRHQSPFCCAHRRDNPAYRFTSFRSVPVWSADEESDSRAALTTTRPISRKECMEIEESVVYKELCDSMRCLEAPSRHLQVLNSEGVVGSSHAHVEVAAFEEVKKQVEPFSVDVRGRPFSLRMLKRRDSRKRNSFVSSGLEQGMPRECSESRSSGEAEDGMLQDVGGSVNNAFSSLVFMMESLQQHTIWLRRVLMSEADAHLHGMMSKVRQEMLDTFLWLFQKVFSCTPKLMLLTMILLVDFAVHSMSEQVALGVMPMGEPPTCPMEFAVMATPLSYNGYKAGSYELGSNEVKGPLATAKFVQESMAVPCLCTGGAGDNVVRTVKIGMSMDGEATPSTSTDRTAMTVEDEIQSGLNNAPFDGRNTPDGEGCLKPGPGVHIGSDGEEYRMFSELWQQAIAKDPRLSLTRVGHMLVAPVQAPALEADDYCCYDRTDLKYQHELIRDPSNPLLLANYAQFLHVVRHDHDRAEILYKRAVKADPVDGEVIGKYASFLWVAKEDVEAADEAYKAALAVDPTNVYHAGSYAHFLWNSSSDQDDCAPIIASHQQVSSA